MGCTLEQLHNIWKRIKHNNRTGVKGSGSNRQVGFVIDTAHIFSSGYDITNVNGITDYLKQFNKLIGLDNICLFHINDSRYKLGERKDEHKGIGFGNIYNTPEGLQALKYIKTLCLKKNIPMILETHSAAKTDSEGTKNNKGYEYEIDLIKKL